MPVEHEAPEEVIQALREKISDARTSLPAKYRALFALRNLKGSSAEAAIIDALQDESALFRHEVAYCLGQRQDPAALPTLRDILMNHREHPMVRHEAGEALGAIGTPECFDLLRAFSNDPCLEVSQTCQLALQRIEYYAHADGCASTHADVTATESHAEPSMCAKILDSGADLSGSEACRQQHPCQCDDTMPSTIGKGNDTSSKGEESSPYLSVDPAPAAPLSTPTPELRRLLLDEHAPIFQRYTALFALRNKGGREEVASLEDSLRGGSALLKHEVAYVLGQVQDPAAIDALEHVLRDTTENAMVRHEAAEALGSIANERCLKLLEDFCTDSEPIVAHSCMVALDMLAYEQSGDFQYADAGHVVESASFTAVTAAC